MHHFGCLQILSQVLLVNITLSDSSKVLINRFEKKITLSQVASRDFVKDLVGVRVHECDGVARRFAGIETVIVLVEVSENDINPNGHRLNFIVNQRVSKRMW